MADTNHICSIDGCSKKLFVKGLCQMHYTRVLRYGDPDAVSRAASGSVIAWIKENASCMSDKCLSWPFKSKNMQGYGVATYEGKQRNASNVMCRIAHGDPPTPKHEAAHSCGKGHEGCVNPKHLRWATRSENHADKHLHGTSHAGEANPQAKLTAEQVVEIRDSKKSALLVSKKYGIGYAYVYQIRSRDRWAHLA